MKVLADENIPLSAVKFLRARGHDVTTLLDIGKTGIPDSEVVEIAEKDGRIILTLELILGTYIISQKRGK